MIPPTLAQTRGRKAAALALWLLLGGLVLTFVPICDCARPSDFEVLLFVAIPVTGVWLSIRGLFADTPYLAVPMLGTLVVFGVFVFGVANEIVLLFDSQMQNGMSHTAWVERGVSVLHRLGF